MQLLKERFRSGYCAEKSSDGHHLALVLECGGMRANAAAGIAHELERRQLAQCFDSVHGSSAGACIASYFVTGQAGLGTRIYDDICNVRFIHPYRGLWGERLVDAKKIAREIIQNARPLAIERILARPGVLHISNTCASTGNVIVRDRFSSADELLLTLEATLTVPSFRRDRLLKFGDRVEIDGGISAPVPVKSALDCGATHILVAGSGRIDERASRMQKLKVFVEIAVLKVLFGRRLAQQYRENRRELFESLDGRGYYDALLNKYANNRHTDVIVRPAASAECGVFTIDPEVISKVRADGQRAAQAHLHNAGLFDRNLIAAD